MFFFLENLQKLLFIVEKRLIHIIGIVIISIISGSIDLIGFAIIIQFISIIMEPNNIRIFENNFILDYFNFSFETYNPLLILSLLLILVFISKAIIAIISKVVIVSFAYKKLANLQTKLMRKYHEMSYLDYLKNSKSYYITSIRDLSKSCIDGLESSLKIISEILVMTLIFIYLAKLNYIALLLLILIILPLAVTYNVIFKPLSISYGKKIAGSYEKIYQLIDESIYGFKEIKVNNKRNFFIKQLKDNANNVYTNTLKNFLITVSPRYIFEVCIVFFVVFFIYLSLNHLETKNDIVPTIGVFAVACARLLPSISSILNDFTRINYSKFATDTCYNDIRNIQNIDLSKRREIENLSFKKIIFKNVSFRYPNSKTNILNKLNFEINQNDVIAIIGPSGSGKTTLIDLLLGLLNPTEGEISINENSSKNENNLSTLSAYLPQDSLVIEDTIKKNISLELDKDKIDLNLINKSLEEANLKTFVNTLPEGVETKIGEDSLRLSGGQTQRLAIARNFYLKKEIIIMDEATSSLDEENEDRIIDSLNNLKGKKTIILITHKFKLLKNFEKIFSLENGRLSKIRYENNK